MNETLKDGWHLERWMAPDGLIFGGRSDNEDNWEGRLDEIAVFDFVFTEADILRLQR